jgi:CheY-specific phosphatase CheX
MTQAHFETWLDEAVVEVLESMCFLSPDGPATETPPGESGDQEPWITRRLEFRGPFEGSFGLRSVVSTSTTIACNLLGEEPDELSAQQVGDSIGEMANMVCGAVLCRAETAHAFDLTSPYEDKDFAVEQAAPGRITRSFALEGGVLTTWLEIRQS